MPTQVSGLATRLPRRAILWTYRHDVSELLHVGRVPGRGCGNVTQVAIHGGSGQFRSGCHDTQPESEISVRGSDKFGDYIAKCRSGHLAKALCTEEQRLQGDPTDGPKRHLLAVQSEYARCIIAVPALLHHEFGKLW